ncbi:hypothetical protein G3N57_05250 [Paraburkholderia sp. Se-20369]|nr:hypothetical protein [Paraburkholderia sp. Se-20369]
MALRCIGEQSEQVQIFAAPDMPVLRRHDEYVADRVGANTGSDAARTIVSGREIAIAAAFRVDQLADRIGIRVGAPVAGVKIGLYRLRIREVQLPAQLPGQPVTAPWPAAQVREYALPAGFGHARIARQLREIVKAVNGDPPRVRPSDDRQSLRRCVSRV